MKKKLLALLMAFALAIGMIPCAFAASSDSGGMQPNEKYYNSSQSFGFDSMTKGGTVAGVTVKVNGSTLEQGNATSTTGAAVDSGIVIEFDPGYYLYAYKIVCGDKYGCQTDAAGNAIQKAGVMNNAEKASITLDASSGITKTAFGHSSQKSPYWLLLDVREDTRLYKVTYDWGDLSKQLSAAVPSGGEYKVSTVVTVHSPSDAALAEAAKLGYSFAGWSYSFTNATFEPGDKFSMPNQNVVLTALWEKAPISITVTKQWNDSGNQDGIQPAEITVSLKNGEDTIGTATLNSANKWTCTFENLSAGGNYSVVETSVPDGYTSAVTGDAASGFTITNTHTPETVGISGAKTWADADDQDGIRPESITINLLADGEKVASKTVTAGDGWKWSFDNMPVCRNGAKIAYTIAEEPVPGYTAAVDGYNVTNSHTPATTSVSVSKVWDDAGNQDGIRPDDITVELLANGSKVNSAILSSGNQWTSTFEELPVYFAGEKIVYTVREADLPQGYTTNVAKHENGLVITNTHTPEVTDISGVKTWEDAGNQDGLRPESVTIRLYADGTEVDSTVASERTQWTYSFTGLPVYANGEKIVYTITEDAVEGYLPTVNGFDVTNTHTPGKTSVPVSKRWDDRNNQDGIRPDSVTVKLLADGEDTGKTMVLTAEAGWTGTFTDLDAFAGGQKIEYTVEEVSVEGYTSSVSGDAATGYTLTNSHTVETVTVSGSKTWDDADNQDGKRPDAITVNLLANGVEVAEVKVSAASQWTYSFEDMPKYEDGVEITYIIVEDAVEGYTATVTGYDLVNSYIPGKISFPVTKAWSDCNDKDGIRPGSVTVKLLANGKDTGLTLTLTAGGKWSGSFTGLDEYVDGQKIVYTVEEVAVKGYSAVITGDAASGFVVTNSHNITPQTGDNSMPILMTGIAAAALCLLVVLAKAKRKEAN